MCVCVCVCVCVCIVRAVRVDIEDASGLLSLIKRMVLQLGHAKATIIML